MYIPCSNLERNIIAETYTETEPLQHLAYTQIDIYFRQMIKRSMGSQARLLGSCQAKKSVFIVGCPAACFSFLK